MTAFTDRRTHNRRSEDRRAHALTTLGWVGPALTLLVVVDAAARAADYLREPAVTEALAYVDVFGFAAWGRTFASTAAVLTVALIVANAWRRVGLLVITHAVAAAIYAVFLVAVFQGVSHDDWASLRSLAFPFIALTLNVIRAITTARAAPALGVRWW